MDKIGYYKGIAISTMSREELLDFAEWAAKKISALEKIERETADFRIEKEIGGRYKLPKVQEKIPALALGIAIGLLF